MCAYVDNSFSRLMLVALNHDLILPLEGHISPTRHRGSIRALIGLSTTGRKPMTFAFRMRGEKQVDPHAQHAQPHPSHLPFARHPVYRAPFVPFGAFPGAAMPPRGRGGFFPDRGRGAGVRGRGRGAFPFGRGASMLPGMMFAHPPPMEDPTLKHGKMEVLCSRAGMRFSSSDSPL